MNGIQTFKLYYDRWLSILVNRPLGLQLHGSPLAGINVLIPFNPSGGQVLPSYRTASRVASCTLCGMTAVVPYGVADATRTQVIQDHRDSGLVTGFRGQGLNLGRGTLVNTPLNSYHSVHVHASSEVHTYLQFIHGLAWQLAQARACGTQVLAAQTGQAKQEGRRQSYFKCTLSMDCTSGTAGKL